MKRKVLLPTIAIVLLLSACASRKSLYQKATEINTIASYEEFLKKYSTGEYSSQVRDTLMTMKYDQAIRKNSAKEYHNFLTQFPDCRYSESVRNKMEDLIWKSVIKDSSIEACNKYVSWCPDGERIETVQEIQNQLETIYFGRAIRTLQSKDIQSYLTEFPDGKHTAEMNILLQEAVYKEARKFNRIAGYSNYLNKYPDGKYKTEASILKLGASDSYTLSQTEKSSLTKQLQKNYQTIMESDSLQELIDFQKTYSGVMGWRERSKFESRLDNLYREKKEEVHRKAVEQNTVEAYEAYRDMFGRKMSYSEKWDLDKLIKKLYQERAQKEFKAINNKSSIEALEVFENKYEGKMSYALKDSVNDMIENLYYQNAVAKDDSISYARYMDKFPDGNNSKEANKILTYFQHQTVVDPILQAKSEPIRLQMFKQYLKENYSDTTFDYNQMQKFIIAMTIGLKKQGNHLPNAANKNSFFEYFAGFQYIPLEEGELDYRRLTGSRMDLLRSISEIMLLYPGKGLPYEVVYLANNIARLAALNAALKGHAYWDSLSYADIRQAQMSQFINSMNASLNSSHFSVDALRYSSAVQMADLEASRNLYGGVVSTMLAMLQSKELDARSKKYILKNLPTWARLVAFDSGDYARLTQISKTDSDPENRRLALKAIKISKEIE